MSTRMRKAAPLLSVFYKSAPRVRAVLLKEGGSDLINALSEVALNVLNGNIRLPAKLKARLARQKEKLRLLARRGVSIKKRKAVLC